MTRRTTPTALATSHVVRTLEAAGRAGAWRVVTGVVKRTSHVEGCEVARGDSE
jgi:hypothetical protein